MPKDSIRTPAYRLHKPSGRAVVTLDGRDVYLGAHGTDESKAEYERVITEWRAHGPRRMDPRGGPTVSMLLAAYLEHANTYYVKNGQPTKEIGCLKTAMRPLRRCYGHTPAASFGPKALKAVREELIRAGMTRNTVNKSVHRIKRIFRWAVAEEMIPPSVDHALQAVPGLRKGRSLARESVPVKPVSDAQVDAIRPHVSPTIWVMIELMRLTGMRPGEVTIMRTCDLDTTGPIWEYRPSSHKTEHHEIERVIPLGPRAQAVVKPLLRTDLNAYLFAPEDSERARNQKRRDARVTPRYPSHYKPIRERDDLRACYTVLAMAKAITRACDRAFPPPADLRKPGRRAELLAWRKAHRWHAYQLRHTAATRIRRELGLEAAQVVLGHAHADVTQIYAERNLSLAREVAVRHG